MLQAGVAAAQRAFDKAGADIKGAQEALDGRAHDLQVLTSDGTAALLQACGGKRSEVEAQVAAACEAMADAYRGFASRSAEVLSGDLPINLGSAPEINPRSTLAPRACPAPVVPGNGARGPTVPGAASVHDPSHPRVPVVVACVAQASSSFCTSLML